MKPFVLVACLAAVSCATAQAQILPPVPIDLGSFPTKASLRCWYRTPKPTNPLATSYVNAEGFTVLGTWANLSASPTSNLFYTQQKPWEMREACERTLAKKGIDEPVIQWNAAASSLSYNHQIWHDTVLSPGATVERIVAFGDSLSDTGNIFNDLQWTFPTPHAWFLGRFSNGPVWTEYFADMTGKPLANWAIGGAETKHSNVFIKGLDAQVDSFGKYVARARGYDPSRTVFTVLAGANDFMNDRSPQIDAVFAVTRRLEASLEKLATLGARKIVLLNLPDISRTPAFRDDPAQASLVRDKTRLYNEVLTAMAARVNKTHGTDIQLVDLAGMFAQVLESPDRFGFHDTEHSCLNMPTEKKTDYLTGPSMTPGCDPDGYVFWDRVHPTTKVHRLIAERVFAAVSERWALSGR